MTEKFDNFLFLMMGAGWSDKKVRDFLYEVERSDPEAFIKRFRTLKRMTSIKPKLASAKKQLNREQAMNQALKLLRSAGPYSENEIQAALLSAQVKPIRLNYQLKGGIASLLEAITDAIGPEEMLATVKSVRNLLVHNPTPGWTTRDLK